MPTAVVTIAGTEAPAAGKTRGRIKGDDGRLFQIHPDLIRSSMIAVGSTYEVTYKDEEFKGTKYRVVEAVAPALPHASPPAPRPGGFDRVAQAAPEVDERGLDIATLAIAKVWLERVPVGDQEGCTHALRVARRAWKAFKANPDNIESGRARPEIPDEEFPE